MLMVLPNYAVSWVDSSGKFDIESALRVSGQEEVNTLVAILLRNHATSITIAKESTV